MNELALFAGAGGGILGGKLLGWTTVCAVEYEPHAVAILTKRQNEGLLEPFPIWDDVRTFDGKPWRGIVDVVSGGFPCQDISSAGKGEGLSGSRSGLWKEMSRIISEVRPSFAFVENSPLLISRGLTRVLSDFTEMGYDARWGIIGANDCQLPHYRKRIWILAYSREIRRQKMGNDKKNKRTGNNTSTVKGWTHSFDNLPFSVVRKNDQPMPGICRKDDGLAEGVDRLERLGNMQVPAVVATAWEVLTQQRTT